MLPILLLLVPPLHYREVKCCSNFRRWCRRYAADFPAVGSAITLRLGVMLPILQLEPPFLHYREGICCSNFRRWYRRYAADFTAVGAAFTLPRG